MTATARTTVLAAAVLISTLLGGSLVDAGEVRSAVAQVEPAPAPAPGRVVLVGDSIMKGAANELDEAFRAAGYDVVVDATESRSTAAGAGVLSGHLAGGGADAVVVMLGANDGANADSYRERVRSIVGATAWVPRIYWLTIPEVRSYYPAANQIVREELALRPGAEVLDWAGVSSQGGMTVSDGLHLTNAGADAMAWFASVNVADDLQADAAAAAAATTTTTASPPTTTAPPTTTEAVADESDSQSSDASGAADDSGGSDPGGSSVGAEAAETAQEAAETADSSIWGLATGTFVAGAAVVVVLGMLGISLAVWALWRTRGTA